MIMIYFQLDYSYRRRDRYGDNCHSRQFFKRNIVVKGKISHSLLFNFMFFKYPLETQISYGRPTRRWRNFERPNPWIFYEMIISDCLEVHRLHRRRSNQQTSENSAKLCRCVLNEERRRLHN